MLFKCQINTSKFAPILNSVVVHFDWDIYDLYRVQCPQESIAVDWDKVRFLYDFQNS